MLDVLFWYPRGTWIRRKWRWACVTVTRLRWNKLCEKSSWVKESSVLSLGQYQELSEPHFLFVYQTLSIQTEKRSTDTFTPLIISLRWKTERRFRWLKDPSLVVTVRVRISIWGSQWWLQFLNWFDGLYWLNIWKKKPKILKRPKKKWVELQRIFFGLRGLMTFSKARNCSGVPQKGRVPSNPNTV